MTIFEPRLAGMARRVARLTTLTAAMLALLTGCREGASGPINVSAIGDPPKQVNPNLQPLDAASAFLLEAAAQGLVRFDSAGEIEPALAQSWIVSDDGRRYTFRIRRTTWADGRRVTAEQVATRLRAAVSRASRNPLKPALGAVDDIVAMTDQVLEISLKGPRSNLLQLLAQPEMAIILNNGGTGPYRIEEVAEGLVGLSLAPSEDEESSDPEPPGLFLRGGRPASAVARFAAGEAELVVGGTISNLPIARAADIPANRLVFDRVHGLFGLVFATAEGPFADPELRRAMSMAIDRQALVATMNVPELEPRFGIVPLGLDELSRPAVPDWAVLPLAERRQRAARAAAALEAPLRIRVAMPSGPGYRLVFAHLRRDWRLIGIEAQRVDSDAEADLRLVDAVAPAMMSAWYLRHFTCDVSPVCDASADQALEAARIAATPVERRAQLIQADQALAAAAPFIALAAPVRWSLVSPRLTGFRPNAFGRHPPGTLLVPES